MLAPNLGKNVHPTIYGGTVLFPSLWEHTGDSNLAFYECMGASMKPYLHRSSLLPHSAKTTLDENGTRRFDDLEL